MKQLLALLLFVPSLCLAQSITLPYNPASTLLPISMHVTRTLHWPFMAGCTTAIR